MNKFADDTCSNILDLIPPTAVIIIQSIKDVCAEQNVTDVQIPKKVHEYLTSLSLQNIPHVRILAALYACLRRSASSGRRKQPSQSLFNDFDAISTLLPYCDAMFIDKECFNLLNDGHVKKLIQYKTQIFSLINKDEFLSYLKNIENNLTPMACV